jgi:drug/metabolite transporter (DMT)-like permease
MSGQARSLGFVDLALLGLVAIWGANFAVVKSALSEMTPMAFNALRFVGASLVTLVLTWVVERDLSVEGRDWPRLLVLGFFSNFVYQTLFINGIARTRASNSSLILATVPVFVALIGTVFRSERLCGRNWVGIVLSLAGVFILITGGSAGLTASSRSLGGDLLVLCATILWALYTLYSKDLMERNSVLKVTAWMMVTSAPLLVLVSVPDLISQDWRAVSAQSWLGLLYSAVLAIGIGYVIWNTGVRRLGSARTAIYSYLTPLVSVIVSRIVLGESMRLLQALGAVAILLGVALGRYRPKG